MNQLTITTVMTATIVCVFAGMAALAWFVINEILKEVHRAQTTARRLNEVSPARSSEAALTSLLRKNSLPDLSNKAYIDFVKRADLHIRRSGLDIPLERLALTCISMGAALWLLGILKLMLSHSLTLSSVIITFLGSFGLAAMGVLIWLDRVRRKRLKAIEGQLPNALDIMQRALRAGHPIVSALQLAAREIGAPLGGEIAIIVDETAYGLELKDALNNFAHRIGSPECNFFAVSVGIQMETGGNLGEILAGLANVMRARASLGRRVVSLSSEGRATAMLLSILAPGSIAFQMMIHPTFYSDKFGDPIFWPAAASAAGLYVIGWVVIQRIVNFKY